MTYRDLGGVVPHPAGDRVAAEKTLKQLANLAATVIEKRCRCNRTDRQRVKERKTAADCQRRVGSGK
jgi:hypothetical protein